MLTNSVSTYGAVTKGFHWLTALLIFTLIPTGWFANQLPFGTDAELARKAWLFSLHKTLGVTLFAVALIRIAWAVTQPKPGLLHADRKLESWLAETVHWLLYGSLVIVPLSGWIEHAASEGFAPIWWPLGQSLPLVPKSPALAETFASLHLIFGKVLIASVLLHIAGALKHHLIDKDATLRRMLPGETDPGEVSADHPKAAPIAGALAAWVAALGIGAGIGMFAHEEAAAGPALAEVASDWQVQEGTLGITVTQMGSEVEGSFADWTAAIDFSETPDDTGKHGSVEVTVSIPSLTLGSVTSQALGPEFFAAEENPTATFAADILADGETYVADGTLTIKETEAPVSLPFALSLDGDTATMEGSTTLDRLNFNLGETYPDESSVAFDVGVNVALTATRQGD